MGDFFSSIGSIFRWLIFIWFAGTVLFFSAQSLLELPRKKSIIATIVFSSLLILLYYLTTPLYNLSFLFYYNLIFCVIYWNFFKQEEKWKDYFKLFLYQIILMAILFLVIGGSGFAIFFIGKPLMSALPDFILRIYSFLIVVCFFAFFIYLFAIGLLLFFKTLSIKKSLKNIIYVSKIHWKKCIMFTLKVTGVSLLIKFLILNNLQYVPFLEWAESARTESTVLFLFNKDVGFCNHFLQSWAYVAAFFYFYEQYEKSITLLDVINKDS